MRLFRSVKLKFITGMLVRLRNIQRI